MYLLKNPEMVETNIESVCKSNKYIIGELFMTRELSEYYSDDQKRSASVILHESNYLVIMNHTGSEAKISEFDNLLDAENKAEDWVMGEL